MPAVTAPIQFFAHAVRISFGDAGEAARAAERFEAAARSCWPEGAAGKPRLWLEEVAAPSTGLKAVRRRSIELTRTIGLVVQPPIRGVMLRYQDGRADIIITCRRSFLSEAMLRHLAALVAGFPGSDYLSPAQPALAEEQSQAAGSATPPWLVPDWACGIPETGDRFTTSRFRLGGAATQGDLAHRTRHRAAPVRRRVIHRGRARASQD